MSDAVGNGLLFFSTRQGRQTNCVLTVEVARYVGELLGRQLVLPHCHTSPLAEHACASMPGIPPQRQTVVPLALDRVMRHSDLARCRSRANTMPLLSYSDVPLSAEPRNATCLTIVRKLDSAPQKSYVEHHQRTGSSRCDAELKGDEEMRTQVPLRFVKSVTIDGAHAFPPTAQTRRLLHSLAPTGDVFLNNAFMTFSKSYLTTKPFSLCDLPAVTEGVLRMERALEARLAMPPHAALCVHWRGEDFHHPHKLQRARLNESAASLAATAAAQVRRVAKAAGATDVLVLSNARFEALNELLYALRAGGLRAKSPRELDGSAFGCATGYVYGTYAEMVVCSKARHFLGSPRSSFSAHIHAMRAARGNHGGMVTWLNHSGGSNPVFHL